MQELEELALQISGYTIVETVSHFPAAVSGVITLEPGVWWVNGEVAMGGNEVIVPEGAYLQGEIRLRDKMVWSTGTGPYLTFVGGSVRHAVKDIALVSTVAGEPVFGLITGKPISIFLSNVDVVGCAGELGASSLVLMAGCALVNVNKGLVFTGLNGNLVMREGNMSGGATPTEALIDLGTATFDLVSISDIQFNVSAGQVGLNGLGANANFNVGGKGEISQCRFNGAGAALGGGVTVDDLQWLFVANPGLLNTISTAEAQLSANSTGTVADGTFEPVAGTYVQGAGTRRFTVSAAGLMTNVGLNPRPYRYDAGFTAQMASGGTKSVSFQLWHTPLATGTPVALGAPLTIDITNQPVEVSVLARVDLETGDAVQLRLRNNADAIGVVVPDLESLVTQIPTGV